MTWYLKKSDGSVYGPVSLDVLTAWAAEGRIAPGETVSPDRRTWRTASELPELEMNWLVELEDGSFYGPIHASAAAEAVQRGSLAFGTVLLHRTSRERKLAGELLCRILLEKLDAVQNQPDQQPPAGAPPGWKELALERDALRREVTKWRHLHEQEVREREHLEERLAETVRALHEEQRSSHSEIAELRRRLQALQQQPPVPPPTGQAPQGESDSAALREAYEGLRRTNENLLRDLNARSAEIEKLAREKIQQCRDSENRIRRLEEDLREARENAEQTRIQLAELQQTHLQLVHSYREMNERMILMRSSAPQKTPAAPPPSPTPQSKQPAPPPSGPPAPPPSGPETAPRRHVKLRLDR